MKESISSTVRESRGILEASRIEAQKVLEGARAEAETLRAEAAQRGLTEAAAELLSRVASAEELRGEALRSARRDVLEVVAQVARAVVGETLAVPPAAVLARIDRALAALVDTPPFRIRIATRDAEALGPKAQGKLPRGVELQGDDALPQGAAVIETRFCSIELDAQRHLEAVLTQLRRGLV